ncbi:hypothetical protein [Deinococcus hohokamensis]|uniref:Carboxypeptidase regulatory-like domain-containing protein n=1 Tax=Deinococcus hohokamensis TaxID=309883 RepID=A0ABV9I961_9DEIO
MNSTSIRTGLLTALFVFCGGGLAAPSTTAKPAQTAVSNTVNGAWRGTFGPIEFTATLKLQGTRVSGSVVVLGKMYPVTGEWKAATGRLTWTYRHINGVVRVDGVLKNGVFQGRNVLNGQDTPATMTRSGSPAGAATPTDVRSPTPYVLKGTVRNAAGQPVPGVDVWADNTLYHNMNVLGRTDAQGQFVLRLPTGQLGTWRAGARFRTVYQNVPFELDLQVNDEAAFSADRGAVRHFTLLTSGPRGDRFWGGTVWPNNGSGYSFGRVEYTFTPVGPLVDGTAGQVLKRFEQHNTIDDIPVGKYRVTARYLPEGGPAQDMQLKSRQGDDWGTSVTITFRREPQYGVMADFDVRLPR